METLEYLAYAGILFVMLVSVFTIDWKDKKTYQELSMQQSVNLWCGFDVPHFWYITATLKV